MEQDFKNEKALTEQEARLIFILRRRPELHDLAQKIFAQMLKKGEINESCNEAKE